MTYPPDPIFGPAKPRQGRKKICSLSPAMPSIRFCAARARRYPLLLSGCLLFLALGASALLHAADSRPVSVPDLCLMLRSGYSDAEVLQETASRPLLEPLTPSAEQTLRAAGAGQRLIDTLKTSRRAASPEEALAARQQQAEQEQRAAAIQQAALQRAQPPQGAPAAPAPLPGARPPARDSQVIENLLRGKLVVFRDEQLQPAEKNALEGKTLIGLYYSRLMSKTGSAFSSDLVQFYRQTVAKHPEFEVVFLSGDPSPYSMDQFVRHVQMPWPAVIWDQLAQVPALARLQDPSGAGRLVLVDNFGRFHADYHITSDGNFMPKILPDLAKLIADPGQTSTLAPPPGAKPSGPAAGGQAQ